MAGYGLPPTLERPGDTNGWWPTTDMGAIDRDGQIVLGGRLDDCIRTRDSRLVNLAAVSLAIQQVDGVRAALALPLASATGSSFGVVLQCSDGETLATLRDRLDAALPAWGRPRRIVPVLEWPRLPGGKTDRLACHALLASDHS